MKTGRVAPLMLKCGIWAVVNVVNVNIANAATVNHVSTSVDQVAQTVDFQIGYNGIPDFLSVDSAGRPADQFRVYIVNPIAWNQFSGFTSIEGAASINSLYLTESLGTINYSNGFGPSLGTLPFNLTNNIVDFEAPFSVLNEPNGAFLYLLVFYNFGGEIPYAFLGTSGGSVEQVAQFSVLPIPTALPLFATGLGALGLLGWRRKRKNAAPISAA